ncbi:MAG: hypothetical protein NDJ90_13670, partial [Oligoflexia bacterium]|nr:hypothetical protein [Oligoflexia bacterium]
MCDCLRRWEKRWVWALAFLAFVALPDRAAAAQPFPRESYAQIRALLGQLASKWPGNAKLFVLGQSDSGLPIEGLQ